jgi:hypothetical protein
MITLTNNNLRYPIENIIEKVTNGNLSIKKMIENNELDEATENKNAHELLRSINFHNSIFGINADYEKMNEVVENVCYYVGMDSNLENRMMIKYYLYDNIEPKNLLQVYYEIEKKNNESKKLFSIMRKDKYGTNNKKRKIPDHTPEANDLLEGGEVKGQNLYNVLKVLCWCRYSKDELEDIILNLKTQKAKSGNRYNEAVHIIRKNWDIWTEKNNG